MKRYSVAAFAAILACIGVSAAAQNLSIGTGGTGGVYYPHGRRHCRRAFQARSGHAGHRRSHRRFGRQPEADRQRQALYRACR